MVFGQPFPPGSGFPGFDRYVSFPFNGYCGWLVSTPFGSACVRTTARAEPHGLRWLMAPPFLSSAYNQNYCMHSMGMLEKVNKFFRPILSHSAAAPKVAAGGDRRSPGAAQVSPSTAKRDPSAWNFVKPGGMRKSHHGDETSSSLGPGPALRRPAASDRARTR